MATPNESPRSPEPVVDYGSLPFSSAITVTGQDPRNYDADGRLKPRQSWQVFDPVSIPCPGLAFCFDDFSKKFLNSLGARFQHNAEIYRTLPEDSLTSQGRVGLVICRGAKHRYWAGCELLFSLNGPDLQIVLRRIVRHLDESFFSFVRASARDSVKAMKVVFACSFLLMFLKELFYPTEENMRWPVMLIFAIFASIFMGIVFALMIGILAMALATWIRFTEPPPNRLDAEPTSMALQDGIQSTIAEVLDLYV